MENRKHINDELQSIAPVMAGVSTGMFYTVPVNYFKGLSNDILNAIAADNLQKTALPFTVPTGYFENLGNNILLKINNGRTAENEVEKELQAIAPLLNTIAKQNIYSVPQGYFEELNANEQLQQPLAKVVALKSSTTWLRYAVAACAIAIFGTVVFIFSHKNNPVDYAIYKKIDVAKGINTATNDELINYLENVNYTNNTDIVNTSDTKIYDVQEHIKTLPEEELKQYLKDVDVPLTDDKKGI